MMYFAVVLVILFNNSFGFHLNFGLDHIFHDLTGGKDELFNFGKFGGSKSTKSADKAHDSSFTTNSPPPGNSKINADSNSNISEETISSLDTVVEKTGSVLNGTTEVVAGEAGKVERVLENSMVRTGQKTGEVLNGGSLESLSEAVAGKETKTKSDSTLGHALEDPSKTTGNVMQYSNLKDALEIVGNEGKSVNSGIMESFMKELSERVSKAVSASILEESLKLVTKNAGGSVRGAVMEDTLRTAVGNVNKAVSNTSLEGSLGNVAEKVGGVVDDGNLEDSLKTPSVKIGGTIRDISSKVPLETLSRQESGSKSSSDKRSSLAGSLTNAAEKVGVVAHNSNLEHASGKASGIVDGITSKVSLEDNLGQSRGTKSGTSEETSISDHMADVSGTIGGVVHSSNLEDSLKITSGKTRNAIGGITSKLSLGKASEQAQKAESSSVIQSSLENVTKNAGGVLDERNLEDSSKISSEDARGAVGGIIVSGKSLGTKTSSAEESSFVDPLEDVSGKVGGFVQDSNLEDSLKSTSGKTRGAVGGISPKDSLETLSGKSHGSESSSVIESSLANVAKNTSGVLDRRNLEDSLKISSGTVGGSVDRITSKVSLENVSRPGGVTRSSSVQERSLNTLNRKIDRNLGDISGDFSEITPDDVGKSLETSFPSVSGRGEDFESGMEDEIQKVSCAISNQLNPLQAKITDEEKYSPKSDVTTFPRVPAVSKFVQNFIHGVNSSELLTKLFNITAATPLQFSQFQSRYVADAYRRLGIIQANDVATFAMRPIAKHFDTIIPEVLVRVYANAFANQFFAEGLLTHDNAEQLALAYLEAMEKSAEDNGVSCDCDYNRNFQAIGDGIFSFLLSVGEPSTAQVWETAFYFAHEWLLAAVDYGSLQDLNVIK